MLGEQLCRSPNQADGRCPRWIPAWPCNRLRGFAQCILQYFYSSSFPFTFPHPSYTAVDTRAVAGIVLKNNIKKTYEQLSAQAPQILEDVKTQCMLHIGDASQLIRATVGLIITMMVQQGDLASWPALLPTLLQLIRNPNPNICQVRIRGLIRVCLSPLLPVLSLPLLKQPYAAAY